MKPSIKLEEILWEITNNCFQGCKYCGSCDIINSELIDNKKIKQIIDNIACYPPKSINISGGNPLLISFDVHRYLTETLSFNDVECKIIINPFNISNVGEDSDILDLYDWVGLSINTSEELTAIQRMLYSKTYHAVDYTTIITNFNLDNIWLFNDISKFVSDNKFDWQIQYTMYKPNHKDYAKAIYENEESVQYLDNKIKEFMKQGGRIILADNINSYNGCGAGTSGIGILANGDVVPCLSMRIWSGEFPVMGNLLNYKLQYVWETFFASFRCNEFTCCKDITHCNKKIKEDSVPTVIPSIIYPYEPITYPKEPVIPSFPPQVIMYGVQQIAKKYTYGVFKDYFTTSYCNDTLNSKKENN